MWFYFSAKGPCCLTWHNGLLAVKTLGWVLIRVALSTQQDLILGSKWFLHKWAAALGTPEASLMPVAAFVGQILGESKFMLMQTFICSVFILQVFPEIKGKTKTIAVVDPSRSAQESCRYSMSHCCVNLLQRPSRAALAEYPSLCNRELHFYWTNHVIYYSCLSGGKKWPTFLMCTDHWRGSPYSIEFEMNLMYF